MPDDIDRLIARAEAAISLWDLTLFSSGTHDARQKRSDVLHEALTNLKAATVAVKASRLKT